MNSKKTPLVIYHGHCLDGFTAAWACWLKHPEWEYHAGSYNQPSPAVAEDRDIYIVDFSYKRSVLLDLIRRNNLVVVLDHHKTAMEDLHGLPPAGPHEGDFCGDYVCRLQGKPIGGRVGVLFDMNRSGARIAWDWFHHGEPLPELVRIVEERDLWRQKSPTWQQTRAITAALSSFDQYFETWQSLNQMLSADGTTRELWFAGSAIERKHNKDVRELTEQLKRPMVIGGVHVMVANLPGTMASDAGNYLANQSNGTFGATYTDSAEGRKFSLRSNADGADVAKIAESYGGGGHARAAGFHKPIGWEGDDVNLPASNED